MKKIILGISVLLLLLVGVYFLINRGTSIDSASANPDYICTKAVTNSPCRVLNYPNSCSAWNSSSHTRTCPGIKTTEVSYYLVRTTCETGYTQVAYGSSGAASGRQGADYVSGSASCSITEYDTVAPSGKVD